MDAKGGRDHAAYVRRVREDTDRYIRDLLAENERLRRLATALRGERDQLEEERDRLRGSLSDAEAELARFRALHEQLENQLSEVEHESQSFSSKFLELAKRNNDLANLYVASYRLHGTLDRSEVLTAIQEIVINLIGSEELGVYELEGSELKPVWSFGLEEGLLRSVAEGSGFVGEAAASGEIQLPGADGGKSRVPGEETLTAAIPLRLGGRVFGVLALFELLPQKGGRFESLDTELFDLLASQAGTALYATSLVEGGE